MFLKISSTVSGIASAAMWISRLTWMAGDTLRLAVARLARQVRAADLPPELPAQQAALLHRPPGRPPHRSRHF